MFEKRTATKRTLAPKNVSLVYRLSDNFFSGRFAGSLNANRRLCQDNQIPGFTLCRSPVYANHKDMKNKEHHPD
jgi:hypothetical protein